MNANRKFSFTFHGLSTSRQAANKNDLMYLTEPLILFIQPALNLLIENIVSLVSTTE